MESEKTYNQHTQIGRMFPQGIEAKSIWFGGNCIFRSGKSNPVVSELFIEGEYTHLIKIGDNVIAYNYGGLGKIAKLKNGNATYETIADHSVKAIGIPSHEMLLMIDEEESKFIFVTDSETKEMSMSDKMKALMVKLNVVTNKVFIANNILYLGTFFRDISGHEQHLYSETAMIRMDSMSEVIYESYGINPGTEIEPGKTYVINGKPIVRAEYDEASNKVFVEYLVSMQDGMVKSRYISSSDFTPLSFTESALISESKAYSVINFNNFVSVVLSRRKIGQYAEGGVDEYQRTIGEYPEYSFGYLITDYQSWLLANELGSGLSRYQYEYQMFGNLLGYIDDRYYSVADDTAEDLWNNPPLRLNHGIWGSVDEGFEKVSDALIEIDTEDVKFGCSNEEGIYFIRFWGGFDTAMYYMTF